MKLQSELHPFPSTPKDPTLVLVRVSAKIIAKVSANIRARVVVGLELFLHTVTLEESPELWLYWTALLFCSEFLFLVLL